MNRRFLALATACAVALTGCSAPSEFESARIAECEKIVRETFEDGVVINTLNFSVSPGSYKRQSENSGIVSGNYEHEYSFSAYTKFEKGTYQCSVSGTDVVLDGKTITQEENR